MTLGYSMQFCPACERETNHRITEHHEAFKKECVVCCHATSANSGRNSTASEPAPLPHYFAGPDGLLWGSRAP